MPIFSLPSKYGVGDFGSESYKFIDFLEESGAKFWQVLPLVQTGYGNSPYSSVCSDSFNPYFISPEILKKKKLVTLDEISFTKQDEKLVDYGNLYSVRFPLLKKAFSRFDKESKEFKAYLRKKESYDYALYMALKYASGQKHFYDWEDAYKLRDKTSLQKFAKDYREEILFWQFVQYEAKLEWLELKKYANKKGIKIIGDIPLYVALDSVDVWTNANLFKLNKDFTPKKVAGVPPDYFSKDGQLWGNPVYDYDVHKEDNFAWWKNRLNKALKIYDYVRIDHFRGLDRYYEIENGAKDAKVGEWVKVPSSELFESIHSVINKEYIIAEDLGIIDDGVRELLAKLGYPGMKILSFAFNGQPNNLYLPQNVNENSVCYTGTHDNDTLKGFIEKSNEWDKGNLYSGVINSAKVLGVKIKTDTTDDLIDSIVELGFACNSNLFIVPMQDLLKKGTEYRINEPGVVKNQNWSVKIEKENYSNILAKRIKNLVQKYNR